MLNVFLWLLKFETEIMYVIFQVVYVTMSIGNEYYQKIK